MSTLSEDVLKRLEVACDAMTQQEKYHFDVTIICTTDDHQAEFWMSQLESSIGKPEGDSKFPMVIAVSEDWNSSGAGNGLGTLYAWRLFSYTRFEDYNKVMHHVINKLA